MKEYVDLLNKILTEGEERHDRTGVGTLSIFGGEVKFDLRERFPLVTIKKTLFKSAFIEMLWFIRGEPNTKFLKDNNVPIWDDWADEKGNLGPVYGVQWRSWPGKLKDIPLRELVTEALETSPEDFNHAKYENCVGEKSSGHPNYETINIYQVKVDQLRELIEGIKKNPTGRRHIVTAWNPGYIADMGLPPCHYLFQCYVSNDGHLDLRMSIRSWDTCLGGPFNIAQYALLTHLIARATDLKPRFLSISYGDAHVYLNHVDAIKERLASASPIDCAPQLVINTENTDIDGYKPDDFDVVGYESHPFLKLPIAV